MHDIIYTLDCGTPSVSDEIIKIEPFNGTHFDATIIFHCEEGFIPNTVIEAVCGSTGDWMPNPASHLCVNQSSGNRLDYPMYAYKIM